jgi:hypothetical protein
MYDTETLDAAEKVVRDMVTATKWANEASLLKRAATAIHKLREPSEPAPSAPALQSPTDGKATSHAKTN